MDINQTGGNKISESANWQGVLKQKDIKQMGVKQGLGVRATMNSKDHSFFIEQSFVYTEVILLSHTSNLSLLYTALSVFT